MSLPQMAVAYQGPSRSFLASPWMSSSGVGASLPIGKEGVSSTSSMPFYLINFSQFVDSFSSACQRRNGVP